MTPTRRDLLTGLGAAGVLTLGGASYARLARAEPGFSRYTYGAPDDTDDRRLRVAWYETYNGGVQETQGTGTESQADSLDPATPPEYVDDVNGPLITLSRIMPGDTGLLVVGLEAADIETDDAGVDVWLRARVTATPENGVNEPESHAPGEDDPIGSPGTDTSGELGDELGVRLWKDSGALSECDGQFSVGETELADGPIAAAFTGAIADGERIIACLPQGGRRCVALRWELPRETGNHVQSDGVAFDLEFVGVSCDAGSPFEVTQ